jgi:hypothetical protein
MTGELSENYRRIIANMNWSFEFSYQQGHREINRSASTGLGTGIRDQIQQRIRTSAKAIRASAGEVT